MAFGIVKFFKKIVKGVAKGVKKVVKGVKKVVKKLGKSKILKALAIAAAVIVTGGAAIAAFAPAAAAQAGTFSAWMVSAGNAITGFTLGGTATAGAAAGTTTAFGTTAATTATGLGGLTGVTGGLKVGSLLKPFASAGKFLGSTAGKATDFLKITDQATRLGGPIKTVTDTGVTVYNYGTGAADPNAPWVKNVPGLSASITPAPPTGGTNWGEFALKTGIQTGASMLAGYAGQGDPRGEMAGLASEGKEWTEPLQVYAAREGINIADIYQNLAFGTGDPGYGVNATLFQAQGFQPVEAAYQPSA